MNRLLAVTAVIETVTGLTLMAAPAVAVRLLLGGETSSVSIPLGRVAGLALLALGIACWPPRETAGKNITALWAMSAYNALVMVYLLFLGIGGQFVGPLLWPAVILHAALTAWCGMYLLRRPAADE